MTGLRGATVILTGATGGLGRAFAHTLAEAGACLVLTGRDRDRLTSLARDLRDTPATVRTVPAELSDTHAMEPVAAEAMRCFGRIDALVNNAGMVGPVGRLWEVDPRDWWQTMEVNLRGTLSGCRAVLPHMIARRHGRIVNIASNAGQARWPLVSAYSVSKAAIIKLTENMAVEVSRHGVAVFAVHPGLLDTGMAEQRHTMVDEHGEAAAPVADWLDRQVAEHSTPVPTAVAALLRLLEGTADHRSGEYISVDDGITTWAEDAHR